TYSYSTSGYFDAYSDKGYLPYEPNVWAVKTIETLPDGNLNVVYSNSAGQVMLRAFVDNHDPANPALEGRQWVTFNEYGFDGLISETAQPSAVTGYDEDSPDLLDFQLQSGLSPYLADSSGVIEVYDYYGTTTAAEDTPGWVAGYIEDHK